MNTLKIALVLGLLAVTPSYADEAEVELETPAAAVASVEEPQDAEAFNEELKELVSAMKQDRAVSKERVKRLKKLIQEKGWIKNQTEQTAQLEAAPAAEEPV